MKLKNIYMLAGALFLGTVALTSCSKDDSYDFDGSADNLAYFPTSAQTPFQSTITITPAGAIGAVGDKINVLFQRPVSAATRVSVQANTALAEAYNAANGTNYTVIPADYFDYSLATVTVEKGQTESTDGLMVKVYSDKLPQMTDEAGYIAAFNISDVQGAGKSSVSRNTYYAIVNTDVQAQLHVVASDVKTCSVVNTPVGRIGGVSFDQPFTFSGALNNAATITLVQDNTLIADYNTANGAEAKELPDGLLDIANAEVTIADGASASASNFKMSIPDGKLDQLADGLYVVPFKISVTKGDGTSVANAGVFYLVINAITASGLINDYATEIPGTAMTGDGVTCLSAENLKPEEVAGFFSTGYSGGWNLQEKRETASCVLDLGESKTITAFNISGEITDAFVEISDDNNSWTELGRQSEHTKVSIPDPNYYWMTTDAYVLYAPMSARYVRITMTLDQDSYMWNYISWGWYPTAQGAFYVE